MLMLDQNGSNQFGLTSTWMPLMRPIIRALGNFVSRPNLVLRILCIGSTGLLFILHILESATSLQKHY